MRKLFQKNCRFPIVFCFLFCFSSAQTVAQEMGQTETKAHFQFLLIDLKGCPSCMTWERHNHAAYLKSELNDLAPLSRIDVHSLDTSAFFYLNKPTIFPTFVLLDRDGQELDRIEGYTSDDFWWGYTNLVFQKHNVL